MRERGVLVVISGFSGAGKGTLVKRLIERHEEYALSISMTTREPRPGEREGVEYFFTDKRNFEETIEKDGLIEYAVYCGNYYGTPKARVEEQLEAGINVILEIEMQGALKVKKKFPESLLIFMTPPSAAELRRRLEGRGTESAEVIERRLARAAEESEGMDAYDYIVVNDSLDQCVEEVHALVGVAHMVPARKKALIAEIREELRNYAKGVQK